jgi:hypothetical protein
VAALIWELWKEHESQVDFQSNKLWTWM